MSLLRGPPPQHGGFPFGFPFKPTIKGIPQNKLHPFREFRQCCRGTAIVVLNGGIFAARRHGLVIKLEPVMVCVCVCVSWKYPSWKYPFCCEMVATTYAESIDRAGLSSCPHRLKPRGGCRNRPVKNPSLKDDPLNGPRSTSHSRDVKTTRATNTLGGSLAMMGVYINNWHFRNS